MLLMYVLTTYTSSTHTLDTHTHTETDTHTQREREVCEGTAHEIVVSAYGCSLEGAVGACIDLGLTNVLRWCDINRKRLDPRNSPQPQRQSDRKVLLILAAHHRTCHVSSTTGAFEDNPSCRNHA